jgi:hypothetical protein
MSEEQNNRSILHRVPLAGGSEETAFIEDKAAPHGIAVNSGHVYWATQGESGAIGRMPLGEFVNCAFNPSCEKQFLTPDGTLEGLAIHGNHLYWSVNGEAPGNPGADLYRFEPATGTLTDLVPHPGGNGAEVRGVLGASDDGSRVYFAANADLDGAEEAQAGNCKGDSFKTHSGECNIYLWHEGQAEFVARVHTSSGGTRMRSTGYRGPTPPSPPPRSPPSPRSSAPTGRPSSFARTASFTATVSARESSASPATRAEAKAPERATSARSNTPASAPPRTVSEKSRSTSPQRTPTASSSRPSARSSPTTPTPPGGAPSSRQPDSPPASTSTSGRRPALALASSAVPPTRRSTRAAST